MHIWTTKGGRKIPVQAMSDEHLKNAYCWAKRNSAHLDWLGGSALAYAANAPDGAAMAAESEADRLLYKSTSLYLWAGVFQKELEKRNLA